MYECIWTYDVLSPASSSPSSSQLPRGLAALPNGMLAATGSEGVSGIDPQTLRYIIAKARKEQSRGGHRYVLEETGHSQGRSQGQGQGQGQRQVRSGQQPANE
jgi:hypothetical protein